MTIRQFITIMILGTLLCWGAWGFVLWNIDPFEAGVLSFVFFYITLLLALAGTISTALYSVYHFFGDVQIPVFRYVEKSTLQGGLSAVFLVCLILLQMFNVLNLWSITFIVLIVGFAISLKISRRTDFS